MLADQQVKMTMVAQAGLATKVEVTFQATTASITVTQGFAPGYVETGPLGLFKQL